MNYTFTCTVCLLFYWLLPSVLISQLPTNIGTDPNSPCRLFIGIGYKFDKKTDSCHILLVEPGSAAEYAGIRVGDILLEFNNVPINAAYTLFAVRNKCMPGDSFMMKIHRGQQDTLLKGHFKHCSQSDINTFQYRLDSVYKVSGQHPKIKHRNPCDGLVWLGVTTSSSSLHTGLKILHVYENSPAQSYGLMVGDFLFSMDGNPLNEPADLINERNAHQPGDPFQLIIYRNNKVQTINGRFDLCWEKKEIVGSESKPLTSNIGLKIDSDPNQIYWKVNLTQFTPGHTGMLWITNNSGKEVYFEEVRITDANCQRLVDVSKYKPGIYQVSVEQGDEVITKQIVKQ